MIESAICSDCGGVGRVMRVTDGCYELTVTLDVGPRILHFSRVGSENVLAERVDESMPVGDRTWRLYGGHRIWHSPESCPRTYMPDNDPVESCALLDDGLVVSQSVDEWTKIRKTLEVRFRVKGVLVRNSLENRGAWDITTAVWAITVVRPGGRVLLPLVQRQGGFLPVGSFALWPYSRLTDRRLTFGSRWICLELEEGNREELKIGCSNLDGWLACCYDGACFVKRYAHLAGKEYPDLGSSSEVYVCHWGGELETLSPMQTIGPGMTVSHEETWLIRDDVPMPRRDSVELDRAFDAVAGRLVEPDGGAR